MVVPWALLSHSDLGAMNAKDWFLVILMSLIPGILGHGLMTWAQRHIDVTLASLLGLASPVISTIGAWIIFAQRSSAADRGSLHCFGCVGCSLTQLRWF